MNSFDATFSLRLDMRDEVMISDYRLDMRFGIMI